MVTEVDLRDVQDLRGRLERFELALAEAEIGRIEAMYGSRSSEVKPRPPIVLGIFLPNQGDLIALLEDIAGRTSDPDCRALAKMAQVRLLRNQGRSDEAFRQIEGVARRLDSRLDPRLSASALSMWSGGHELQGRLYSALEAARAATDLRSRLFPDEDTEDTLVRRAHLAALVEDFDEEYEACKDLYELQGKIANPRYRDLAFFNAGKALVYSKRFDEALAWLDDWKSYGGHESLSQGSVLVSAYRIMCHLGMGDIATAVTEGRRMLEWGRGNKFAWAAIILTFNFDSSLDAKSFASEAARSLASEMERRRDLWPHEDELVASLYDVLFFVFCDKEMPPEVDAKTRAHAQHWIGSANPSRRSRLQRLLVFENRRDNPRDDLLQSLQDALDERTDRDSHSELHSKIRNKWRLQRGELAAYLSQVRDAVSASTWEDKFKCAVEDMLTLSLEKDVNDDASRQILNLAAELSGLQDTLMLEVEARLRRAVQRATGGHEGAAWAEVEELKELVRGSGSEILDARVLQGAAEVHLSLGRHEQAEPVLRLAAMKYRSAGEFASAARAEMALFHSLEHQQWITSFDPIPQVAEDASGRLARIGGTPFNKWMEARLQLEESVAAVLNRNEQDIQMIEDREVVEVLREERLSHVLTFLDYISKMADQSSLLETMQSAQSLSPEISDRLKLIAVRNAHTHGHSLNALDTLSMISDLSPTMAAYKASLLARRGELRCAIRAYQDAVQKARLDTEDLDATQGVQSKLGDFDLLADLVEASNRRGRPSQDPSLWALLQDRRTLADFSRRNSSDLALGRLTAEDRQKLDSARRQMESAIANPAFGVAKDGALARFEEVETELRNRYPGFALSSSKSATLGDVQKSLDRGSAILEIHTGKNRSLLVLTTGNRQEPYVWELVDLSRSQLAALSVSFDSSVPTKETDEALSALYKLLIAPIEGRLKEIRTLVICPEPVLSRVPWGALAAPGGKRLVERFTVLENTSASSYVASKGIAKGKRSKARGSSLVVGISDFGSAPATPGPGRMRDRGLSPLPGARREAELVAKLLGSVPLLERKATPRSVSERAPSVDVIHIASHAVTNASVPLLGFLALSKGEDSPEQSLFGTDVLKLDLSARMTVLSACSSLGRMSLESGVAGLAWAFLVAGCPTVVATKWDVEDEQAAEWIEAFYRAYVGGATPAESHRQACLQMIRIGKPVSSWAAWSIIGAGD